MRLTEVRRYGTTYTTVNVWIPSYPNPARRSRNPIFRGRLMAEMDITPNGQLMRRSDVDQIERNREGYNTVLEKIDKRFREIYDSPIPPIALCNIQYGRIWKEGGNLGIGKHLLVENTPAVEALLTSMKVLGAEVTPYNVLIHQDPAALQAIAETISQRTGLHAIHVWNTREISDTFSLHIWTEPLQLSNNATDRYAILLQEGKRR